ncbi:flagellar L-ring protein precursor FlgH [Rhizomicrobium palustre]|uniref:Flagellar L-ring protein n=1 Tax=Rhizomicrobium palustre TaxID=189966 RepID=A0A846MYH0_9PROT|nr:flagellar basal body L-ring protein FlgH [Rhizomicrobium palustre]NIK88040.1 flagellar L-ring protein precursor FlgH [Rhizomicrobium palustre]
MNFRPVLALSIAALFLSACSSYDRLDDLAHGGPRLASMTNGAPQVSVPMPQPPAEPRGRESLWQPGARSFFHDPRASRVGDIITVNVAVADTAKLSNQTSRSRTNSDNASLGNFFGLEKNPVVAAAGGGGKLVNMGSDTSNAGAGTVARSETINMTLAALVTQVLPNGNMVIAGHQQMKVNGELRDLTVTGIVRTEDITSSNTIDLTQIAEARINYGGRGTVSDMQQPRLGSQLYDILMPW